MSLLQAQIESVRDDQEDLKTLRKRKTINRKRKGMMNFNNLFESLNKNAKTKKLKFKLSKFKLKNGTLRYRI